MQPKFYSCPVHTTVLESSKQRSDWTENRVLSADHGRPLPPLDGAVLANKATHSSSRSARIVVERQLVVEQGRDTTCTMYMSSLALLAVSVPPPILGI